MLVGAREQECLLFRKRQSVMAAALGVIQHRRRFSIPLRERVGDPTDVVKVAVDVQWTLRSQDITHDGGFRAPCWNNQHCANRQLDNFVCPHFDSVASQDV